MKKSLILPVLILISTLVNAGCPVGSAPAVYGTNNVWIGYVFDGINFDTYKGYVNEGSSSSPNFDESFGGTNSAYNTLDGCSTTTETFSMRYKLAQSFVDGDYTIVVGGDDGYRLSLDGGATWAINSWVLQSYTSTTLTVHLNGSTNLVLEYYENSGDNRVSFNITKDCTTTGTQTVYGTGTKWLGYVYSGMNFDSYKGYITEGSSVSPNFDEGFGGDVASFATTGCSIVTTQFSVRFRLRTVLTSGVYTITVGADDGYRLSLNGGSTYVINKWSDQGYNTTTYTATLSGSYDVVLEYYENAVSNRVSFSMSGGSILPVTLTGFEGNLKSNHEVDLGWKTMMESGIDHYEMERSGNGQDFTQIGRIGSQTTISTHDYQLSYHFTDSDPLQGISYYRIKVIGKDNYSNISPVVQVNNNEIRGIKIYPTLIQNNTVFVETDKTLRDARLEFFDLSGKKISETSWESLNGRQNCQVARSNRLPSGTYVARLTANGQPVKNQLMIVQNN
ncbi:MAG TPA: hypothetical protein VGM24_09630 [Puia sp.]